MLNYNLQLQLKTSISNLNFKFHLQAPTLAELGPAQPQLVSLNCYVQFLIWCPRDLTYQSVIMQVLKINVNNYSPFVSSQFGYILVQINRLPTVSIYSGRLPVVMENRARCSRADARAWSRAEQLVLARNPFLCSSIELWGLFYGPRHCWSDGPLVRAF